MNRRTFLKSLIIASGTTVVCPGELLKCESKTGFYDFNPFGSEANRKKYRQNIIKKTRQGGIQHYHYTIPPLIIGAYDETI